VVPWTANAQDIEGKRVTSDQGGTHGVDPIAARGQQNVSSWPGTNSTRPWLRKRRKAGVAA